MVEGRGYKDLQEELLWLLVELFSVLIRDTEL